MLPTIPTIPRMMAASAARWPGRIAIEDDGQCISYPELDRLRRRVAGALIRFGVKPGDRVAIWAPNGWQWIAAALGIHTAGAVLVPVNTRMKGQEAAYILGKSQARLLFCIGEFLGAAYPQQLAGIRPDSLQEVVVLGESPRMADTLPWDEFLQWADEAAMAQADQVALGILPDDASDILFTSGTTGYPKGVITAHGQNLSGMAVWAAAIALSPGDRYLIVNPFFHAFGYKAGWLAGLMAGATLYPLAVFDAGEVLKRIARDRISVLPGAPTLFLSLLEDPRLQETDISSLRATVTGAASVPPALIARMRSELGFKLVLTGYGLTESSGIATLTLADDSAETIARTCGRPLPGVEIRIAAENGEALPAGMAGEVWIRGFNVMQGYFGDSGATADAIDADGWLHTGDVGVLDEGGYLAITDRLKDMFIVGGFNVYPAEIERTLALHPQIAQVAVIGVADDRMGEVGKAYIVPRAGFEPAGDEIVAWCRTRMANYKVPREVEFVAALPLNASGKVLKNKLRELAHS
ncbi:FadD3 family acyl-CoA ligase [Craterilacuibacter sinensis]|uniref:AMP-binding protein n=1 Tax=Craterilacuibacter sinensis TaxID=2686017 RepID=A0A845BRD9_9NEIS|nr:FadD3 family acyl-CoA ligase [Craterilacuibacter sinensis]MXR37041.1 AMP-binding protein [Craterilacuibacter sinensis]